MDDNPAAQPFDHSLDSKSPFAGVRFEALRFG
jgi:hypothetical protein